MVGGLSKNVDHQGWPTTKSALKLSPKNEDLDQNMNDSKISYLEFFFWKYYFGHAKFLYLSRRSSGYHQSFFLISDFLAENLKANKNLQKRSHVLQYSFAQKLHYYTNINSLDIENNMPPQHNQEPFWLYKFSANMFTAPFLDAQELHSWGTLKANVCIFLYISLRTFLFQRRSKVSSGKGWDGGRLNNFLKAACCMGLLKYFTIFRFNW